MKPRGARFPVGFDSEDDGEGHPFLWCFTHREGAAYYRNRGDALMYFANMAAAKKARKVTVEAWAVNLEYDLFNLFPPDRVPELYLRFGRSNLCGARWRGVEFRDTIRHVPVGAEAWGELLGVKKQRTRMFDTQRGRKRARFNDYLIRCQSDSKIAYRAAMKLHEIYGTLGVYPRMTLASTALAIWQTRYFKRTLYRPAREVWQAAHEAYHGGRTEAFAVGTFKDVSVIDVASMFPWAMITKPLPVPWGLFERVPEGGTIHPLGIYRVQVVSRLKRPRLPVRTPHGTIYPNGQWVGRYVGEELLAFLKAGGRVHVLSGYRFMESCRPFNGYVRDVFRRKQRSRGVARLLYKTLAVAIYGKFGQRGRVVRAVPLSRFFGLPRVPLVWREWNGLAIFSQEGAPPLWGNMVWPAFVTARARVRLADELEAVPRALYCDTDSIMYLGKGRRYPSKAKTPGLFEMRGSYREALIIGKKEYALRTGPRTWEPHAKGVPYAERIRYLLEGVADFKRPTRMREASRDGSQVNVWRPIHKERRTVLRGRKGDGALPVAWITHAPDVRPRS